MLLQPLLILGAQLLYVPLVVLRTLMMVKGEKEKSALFATLEGGVHVVALGIVFSDLSNYWSMAAYAIGFGVGMYLGALIEERLAIGYVSLQVNTLENNKTLINRLREVGFSVSVVAVEGIDSLRYRLDCTARRDRENEFMKIIAKYEPNAFVVSFEPRSFKGGYVVKGMKKQREKFLKRKAKEKKS
ncbi:DUF2179 domain-containing protein [Bacillus sp. JCM 19041]|uniref:DUF2179 domain-containing protein n=1 Tax=Bacillus sp. JCM 19041 TaxID=1460637 RepID=UPI0006D273CE